MLMTLYRWTIIPAALLILPLLAFLGNRKIREGLKLRWKNIESKKLPSNKDPIWIHCSSGEFEYAKPIIRAQKESDPETPIIVSYYSPTYRSNIEAHPDVDFSLPLPWDLPGPISSLRAWLVTTHNTVRHFNLTLKVQQLVVRKTLGLSHRLCTWCTIAP